MDPTKSFDHLDPKLKETYARVMGTDTSGGNNNTPAPTQPLPADSGLSATPTTFDSSSTNGDQLTSSPFAQTTNPTPTSDTGPNPGTEPTVSSIPNDTSSLLSTPTGPDSNASTTASPSFFSNPSPATSDPMQATNENPLNAPIEPPVNPTPVTPYTPEDIASTQYTQPLPSPSSVNQTAVHGTSPLLKVLYIILAVILFAVYTVFWMVVFHLPLPFPLPF